MFFQSPVPTAGPITSELIDTYTPRPGQHRDALQYPSLVRAVVLQGLSLQDAGVCVCVCVLMYDTHTHTHTQFLRHTGPT